MADATLNLHDTCTTDTSHVHDDTRCRTLDVLILHHKLHLLKQHHFMFGHGTKPLDHFSIMSGCVTAHQDE